MGLITLVSEDLTNAFSNGWIKAGDHNIALYSNLADYLFSFPKTFYGSSLFFWTDGGPLNDRTAWIQKTYTGLPANTEIGVRIQSTWILRLNLFIFMELVGATTNHIRLEDQAYNFWTLPDSLVVPKKQKVGYVKTTAGGELTVKLGIESAFRTNNLHFVFESNLELVTFTADTNLGQIVKLKKLLTAG